MKNLKYIMMSIAFVVSMTIIAQEHPIEKMKTTKVKNFTYLKDSKEIPYKIKVYENRKYALKFEDEDKGKLNQDRKKTPAYVTKLIFVDNDVDPKYDKYIVLKYEKFPNDSFELVPTTKGFAIKVDDKHLKYVMGEGVYYVNNSDKDFFVIDEFSTI